MWGSLGRGSFVQRAGAPQRRGLPNGAPDGSRDPVGYGGRAAAARPAYGAPAGSTDPVGKGGRAAAARAARNEMEGQHELSGGRARRGSARVKRRLRPPWVSTSQAEAAPAVTVGRRRSSEWFPPILPKRQRHGKGLRCFHAKTAPGGSLPRGWCGDFVSGYRICRYSFPAP